MGARRVACPVQRRIAGRRRRSRGQARSRAAAQSRPAGSTRRPPRIPLPPRCGRPGARQRVRAGSARVGPAGQPSAIRPIPTAPIPGLTRCCGWSVRVSTGQRARTGPGASSHAAAQRPGRSAPEATPAVRARDRLAAQSSSRPPCQAPLSRRCFLWVLH